MPRDEMRLTLQALGLSVSLPLRRAASTPGALGVRVWLLGREGSMIGGHIVPTHAAWVAPREFDNLTQAQESLNKITLHI